jgi:hypothetical protein
MRAQTITMRTHVRIGRSVSQGTFAGWGDVGKRLNGFRAHSAVKRSNAENRRDTCRVRFGLLPLLLVVVLTLASCGDDNEAEIPGGADPEATTVIDDWSTRLRNGDVDAAAELFAIPSVAQNGPTLRIDSVADARLFNASLPCGAELIRAEPDGELVLATFRLTERPGPGSCGSGAGETAQTDFLIEDGKIVEWRRVVVSEEEAPSSSA